MIRTGIINSLQQYGD